MPTCTPQLCFGNTGPSYNPEPDYGSYSLNPGEINVGKVIVSDTFVMFGEWTLPTPKWKYGAQYRDDDIVVNMRKTQPNPGKQTFLFLANEEIDAQISAQITGGDPLEIDQSIISEIRNKIKTFIQGQVPGEIKRQIQNTVLEEKRQWNLKQEDAKGYIDFYMKIKSGRWRAPFTSNTSLDYPVNFVYNVKLKLPTIAFCKKLEDQFNFYGDAAPDISKLDEKWQPFMQSIDEILTAICVAVDVRMVAEDIATKKLTDENFIPASEVPVYFANTVRPNRVISPYRGVSSAGLNYLIQKAGEQTNRGSMLAGIFGGGNSVLDSAIAWATAHLSANGPLVEGGISIPYLIDENGNITWDAHFYYSFGLTEAWSLASNTEGYINTVLTNAGILQNETQSDNDLINFIGAQGNEQNIETNLNLNGITTSPNGSRESGGGSPGNSIFFGGNSNASASPRPGGRESILNRAQNIGNIPK
jgi:hypothetical protein